MMGIVCRRVSIDRARVRKDSAPVTTAVGRFVGGRVPFAPRLLSSAVVAGFGCLSSFLCAFHATIGTDRSCSGQDRTREEREE